MLNVRHATQSAAKSAIVAAKGKVNVSHFAAGHIDLVTRQEYWMVKELAQPIAEKGAPVRSERHVYTASGKKRTNKEVCLALFKKHSNKVEFCAAAVAKGVKHITAATYFDDIKAGRVTAAPAPAAKGETKMVRNLMSGAMIEIDANTPRCCDPSTELYWSM